MATFSRGVPREKVMIGLDRYFTALIKTTLFLFDVDGSYCRYRINRRTPQVRLRLAFVGPFVQTPSKAETASKSLPILDVLRTAFPF